MKKEILILFAVAISFSVHAQEVNELIESGNKFYRQQEYAKASAEYLKALQIEPANVTAKFNQANALYKQDKKVDAAVLFNDIAAKEKEKSLLAKAWYNKGVILSDQKNLEESIEAYKNTLRNNPDDNEARENLQKALLELKKKQPPKKQDDQQKKKKDQQQQRQESKMSMKEAEQRLKLLQQKEKEVQQRVQKQKIKGGGSQAKDW
jgi:Ca-activated chloride channel family protein